MFYFHPYLGKIPILTNIFQMGWFNHQPGKVGSLWLQITNSNVKSSGPANVVPAEVNGFQKVGFGGPITVHPHVGLVFGSLGTKFCV